MTSSNGKKIRVTGPWCGEFTGPGEFPTQRPVKRSFDVFFDLRLNKRLGKQPRGCWFETPSWSLWRQCNEKAMFLHGIKLHSHANPIENTSHQFLFNNRMKNNRRKWIDIGYWAHTCTLLDYASSGCFGYYWLTFILALIRNRSNYRSISKWPHRWILGMETQFHTPKCMMSVHLTITCSITRHCWPSQYCDSLYLLPCRI